MAILATVTFADDYKRTTKREFEMKATTLAQAATDLAALLADYMAVTLCGTILVSYNQKSVLSDAIETGANVDGNALLQVRMDNAGTYTFDIPAIDPALINPDGTVKLDAAAIVAFLANFESAGQFTIANGRYVVSSIGGKLDK